MLNERFSQCHYLYRSSICHYSSSKLRLLSAFRSARFSCSSKTKSGSAPLHSVAARDVSPCACLPSAGAVSGNCLCNLMTPYLYLAEKVVTRICPAQFFFFFFLRFQYSESHSLLKGTLALTVSEWKEASSIAQGCLFTGSFIPRNSMDTHYTAKIVCATLPPPPNMRAAGSVGALMAFKCFSKTRKQA